MQEEGEDYVSTRRLVEIVFANFVASAFVAAPFGILLSFLFLNSRLGPTLEIVGVIYVGWSLSWGLFSAGRAWQKNRADVVYPAPMRQVLNRLGLNGQTEYFVNLLYLPGVQIPDGHRKHPVLPKILR